MIFDHLEILQVIRIYEDNVIVGAKVQNSCVLGLGLARVQVDKYWILGLIRELEFPRNDE